MNIGDIGEVVYSRNNEHINHNGCLVEILGIQTELLHEGDYYSGKIINVPLVVGVWSFAKNQIIPVHDPDQAIKQKKEATASA